MKGPAEDRMRNLGLFLAAGVFAASLTASPGQIVRPIITPPPCTGNLCLKPARGVPVPGVVHRMPCPPGTVYNPQKGTCKVVSNGMPSH